MEPITMKLLHVIETGSAAIMLINFFVIFSSVILLQSGYSVSEIAKTFDGKRSFKSGAGCIKK